MLEAGPHRIDICTLPDTLQDRLENHSEDHWDCRYCPDFSPIFSPDFASGDASPLPAVGLGRQAGGISASAAWRWNPGPLTRRGRFGADGQWPSMNSTMRARAAVSGMGPNPAPALSTMCLSLLVAGITQLTAG